ncbi:unnamed protein product [Rotaria magnacalcarata]|uniref:F-box domain-containing protein n=2 Tax=Rotaria magnacalcarata TaxID=392030 RepID=A0A815EZ46_9BILA|nr:unnamed protein product [Rotaria magnacalcarata]CAF4127587.1 unnamed protein product [Rotaria magnacalcarata]
MSSQSNTFTSTTCSLNDLPVELLTTILFKLADENLHDLLILSCTCRLWRSIIVNNFFLEKRFNFFKKKYLIGHWTFEDANQLGHDSSGYTKDQFSLIGNPVQSNCFLGSCLRLDGNSVITVPVNEFSRYQTDYFSVSCWFLVERWNPPNNTMPFQTVVGAWEHPNQHWLHLGFSEASQLIQNQVIISADHVQFDCNSTTTVKLNTWYHVVTQVSRKKQEIFVNGDLQREVDMTLKAMGTITWTPGQIASNAEWSQQEIQRPEALCIGAKCLRPIAHNFWLGQVADLCIWTRWLEPIEIKATYQSKTKSDNLNMGQFIVDGMKKLH